MPDPSSAPHPLVVGANHRSSSLTLRDRLFVEERVMPAFLRRLREAGIEQAIVLSTCDRVEVQAAHPQPQAAAPVISAVLAEHAELRPADLNGQIYTLTDAEAVKHIFSVASSLDSLIIGEPQVFGQVKDSHRLAREAGLVGSDLEAILQAAYHTAKRVRSETAVGERPVSISAAAVQLARDLHGDLSRCAGLLVGAGDMGELVAGDLLSAGLDRLNVVHPTRTRAEPIARHLGCHVGDYDRLGELLAGADVVLTSMGTRTYVIDPAAVKAALAARKRRPMFLIDTGIPGDIDPAVDKLEGAFLYDLNDLEKVAMEGRASREGQARNAWKILEGELDLFVRGRAERAAVPALTRLRQHFETVRQAALRDSGGDADKATHLLINRLLHTPSESLRETAAREAPQDEGELSRADLDAAERVLSRLFRLEDDDKRGDGEP
ncbi:MAG: glutamyl-tRNA reductase [Hyphomicrobiales bacterium]|nr:glutamyl-tRNA reductase [Hyphomicrobiales bacterium]MCP5370687.1 glutamyl-tRNA reductase [Hyphomicrobiales bacterium]